jgi:hypothetical protein
VEGRFSMKNLDNACLEQDVKNWFKFQKNQNASEIHKNEVKNVFEKLIFLLKLCIKAFSGCH